MNTIKKDRYYYVNLALCLVFALMLVLCFHINSPVKVYADYEDIILDPTSIVNFNQLINTQLDYSNSNYDSGRTYFNCIFLFNESPWGSFITYNSGVFDLILTASSDYTSTLRIKHGGQTQDLSIYTQYDFNIINGHKYYFRINVLSANPSVVDGLQVKDFIVIDISSMFGADNLPTIQQCRELFVADYYPYNTGTPMSFSSISAYNDALQDIFSSYTYSLDLNVLGNNTFAYAYQNEPASFLYDTLSLQWKFVNTIGVPLFTTLNAGAVVSLDYWYWFGGSYPDYYLNVMAYDASQNFVTIYTDSQVMDPSNGNTCTFTLPFSVDTLYFNIYYNGAPYASGEGHIFQFDLKANQLDIAQAVQSSYQSGYNAAVNSFKRGGSGYELIFEAGKQFGIEHANEYTFTGLISAVVDTPIKAFTTLFDFDILGVNMKTFYLSIFTLCMVVTIIRLVL